MTDVIVEETPAEVEQPTISIEDVERVLALAADVADPDSSVTVDDLAADPAYAALAGEVERVMGAEAPAVP